MTPSSSVQWLLAFDASCNTCQSIAGAVAEAGGGRLDVVPLQHPQAVAWRAKALGADAPSRPTLLCVEGERVRAWTNRGMIVPLVRSLGFRATARVVAALGELKHEAEQVAPPGPEGARTGMTRKQLLRLAGGGVAVAAGLVMGSGVPAFAAQRASSARTWVEQTLGHLPQRYEEVAALPEHYRRAVFQASTPQVQNQLLLDHLARRRSLATDLTVRQTRLFDEVSAYLKDQNQLTDPATASKRLKELEDGVIAAFDRESAIANFGALGPVSRPSATILIPQCECSVGSSFASCDGCQQYRDCNRTYKGCGFLLQYDCTGMCEW